MIRIHGIKLDLSEVPDSLLNAGPGGLQGAETGSLQCEMLSILQNAAAKRLHVSADDIDVVRIARLSLDAREKPRLYRVFSLDIRSRKSDDWIIKVCRKAGLQFSAENTEMFEIRPLDPALISRTDEHRPVVVGFGPCGMFAALALAEYGLRPIVLERGSCMEERIAAVEAFWNGGPLDLECNVQFGEGGAGTFSDGKLTTGTKSVYSQWILEQFVEAGASPGILYLQKPHIGTDVLRTVVVNIRRKIESLGGEIHFNCRADSLFIKDGKVCGVNVKRTDDSENRSVSPIDGSIIPADTVILALGHSARDTIRALYSQGILMEQKPFSMGVRIEHPQDMIDIAQYGVLHEELGTGAADYKLNVKTGSGRGVYTFCMCPGGYVINASSAPGMLTTNGMSNSDRSSGTANSGLLADVLPEDYAPEYLPYGTDPSHPLAGIAFQEKYERLAFELGGGDYRAPVQTVGEFLDNMNRSSQSASPSFRPGTRKADLRKCLPDFVTNAVAEALPLLGKKLQGFDAPDAVMTAIESRSSSPVRIKRDPLTLQAVSDPDAGDRSVIIRGLYPAGEGAGYAGGIMSAAADGMRIAVTIADLYSAQTL